MMKKKKIAKGKCFDSPARQWDSLDILGPLKNFFRNTVLNIQEKGQKRHFKTNLNNFFFSFLPKKATVPIYAIT